jgi:hypothetical protein
MRCKKPRKPSALSCCFFAALRPLPFAAAAPAAAAPPPPRPLVEGPAAASPSSEEGICFAFLGGRPTGLLSVFADAGLFPAAFLLPPPCCCDEVRVCIFFMCDILFKYYYIGG